MMPATTYPKFGNINCNVLMEASTHHGSSQQQLAKSHCKQRPITSQFSIAKSQSKHRFPPSPRNTLQFIMQATTHHKSGISSSQYHNANKDPSWVKLAIVCTVTSEQMTDHWSSSPRLAKSQSKKRHSLGQETPARKSSRKQRSSLQHHNARPQPLAESQCKQRPTTSQIDNRLQSRNASNDLSQVKEQQLAHQRVSND
jgi:hypothetical protein